MKKSSGISNSAGLKSLPTFILVLLAIFAIRSSLIEPFRIPNRSMLPGLMSGDFLFANKFQYGLRFPFSDFFWGKAVYVSEAHPPKRGDVVIFMAPEAGQESMYIKRVIGLPGDRIQFEQKKFFLNGEEIKKVEILGEEREALFKNPRFDPQNRYENEKLHLYRESLGNLTYAILQDDRYESVRTEKELVIPENHFFVLGDNRDDTRDSRTFGVVPFSSLRGRAIAIWWPPSRMGHAL